MVPHRISFSWQAQPKMNLGGFKFQRFSFFSGIFEIVFVDRIDKLLVLSTIRSGLLVVSQSGQPLGPLPSSWCPMETWQNRFGSPSTSAGHLLAKVWGCGSVHRPIHPTGKAWKTKLHATRRFCRKLEDRPIDF